MCRLEASVCIITKNECDLLRRCLTSLSSFGLELVVVDTGSEDGTVEMAGEFTDSIYEFPWIGDFAAARNFAVSKAKYDTIIVVDSDEYYVDGDIEQLTVFAKEHPDAIGQIRQRQNTFDESGEPVESVIGLVRVFDRRFFHYAGKVHEQLVRGSVFDPDRDDRREMLDIRRSEEPVDGYETGLFFVHDGYSGTAEERRIKAKRNVELLLKEVEQYPYSADLLYQTAKSVYVAEGAQASLEYYERALGLELDPQEYWVRDMICCYGYALLELERYEQALSLEVVYEELKGYADYLFLMGLIHMNNSMFDLARDEFIKCTELGYDRTVGTNSYKAYYNAGVIEECLGNTEKAREYYTNAGEYQPAKEGLERI